MAAHERHDDMGARFRELIARPEGLFGFGVTTALDAALAAAEGQESIYAGGYSIAMAKMWPDMGLMNMVEVAHEVEHIVRAAPVPVIADIDDGYGSALNVYRTTEEFLGREIMDPRTGRVRRVAGIHLEDQVYPKRCGHIAGKEVVPIEVAVGKIRMAAEVRNALTPNAVIIARTDAYHSGLAGSMEDAVARGIAYAEAGADLVWCEFNQSDEKSATGFAAGIRRAIPGYPLAFNYSPSLPWHKERMPMTFGELNNMGYKYVFITIAAAHAASYAVAEYAKAILEKGAAALWAMQDKKAGHPTESHHRMAGVPHWQELERRYSPAAGERQERSEGFK